MGMSTHETLFNSKKELLMCSTAWADLTNTVLGKEKQKMYCVIPPTHTECPERYLNTERKLIGFPGAEGGGKSEDWVQKGTFWGGQESTMNTF